MFQSIDSLWYAGNNADPRFDTSKNYLGEWSKETLYNDLTDMVILCYYLMVKHILLYV